MSLNWPKQSYHQRIFEIEYLKHHFYRCAFTTQTILVLKEYLQHWPQSLLPFNHPVNEIHSRCHSHVTPLTYPDWKVAIVSNLKWKQNGYWHGGESMGIMLISIASICNLKKISVTQWLWFYWGKIKKKDKKERKTYT